MSAPVFIGDLNRRVTLQRPDYNATEAGSGAITYVNAVELWAHVKVVDMSGRFAADRREAVVTHQVTFRAIADFSAGCRFILGGRVLEVIAFDECEGSPIFLRAFCEEVRL